MGFNTKYFLKHTDSMGYNNLQVSKIRPGGFLERLETPVYNTH